MPELPEVESIKLQLQKLLVRHRIERVEINYHKCFSGDEKKLLGNRILDIRRFGKALVIDLENNFSIVIHIKMTGQLIYRGPNLKSPFTSKKITGGFPGKHTHVVFYLDRGGILYYNDVRKFGWIDVVKGEEATGHKFIRNLGKEFLKDLSLEYFKELLARSSRAIKLVIMDQGKMAGVGNIYANDALWLARINPKKEANKLTNEEIKKLFGAIDNVLKEGIYRGGASELAFVTPDGGEGNYQNFTLVYGHEGDECKNCKSTIEKFMLGDRGTYWCPKCQI